MKMQMRKRTFDKMDNIGYPQIDLHWNPKPGQMNSRKGSRSQRLKPRRILLRLYIGTRRPCGALSGTVAHCIVPICCTKLTPSLAVSCWGRQRLICGCHMNGNRRGIQLFAHEFLVVPVFSHEGKPIRQFASTRARNCSIVALVNRVG